MCSGRVTIVVWIVNRRIQDLRTVGKKLHLSGRVVVGLHSAYAGCITFPNVVEIGKFSKEKLGSSPLTPISAHYF